MELGKGLERSPMPWQESLKPKEKRRPGSIWFRGGGGLSGGQVPSRHGPSADAKLRHARPAQSANGYWSNEPIHHGHP